MAGVTAVGVTRVAADTQGAPPACALKPDDLATVFGVSFAAGVPEASVGTGCRYATQGGSAAKGTDFALWLGIAKPSGPIPAFRAMMGGPGHEYVEVKGDKDRAVWVRHGGGVPPFPSISYERGGYLVDVHITGAGYPADPKGRAARVEALNQKLLSLPRVP